jgi:hypothetical protein
VSRRSVGLVCDIIQRELERGAGKPVDMLIRDEAAAGELRVRCLFPFITSVLPGAFASTRVPHDDKQLSVFAMELPRHSFFVVCDQRAHWNWPTSSCPIRTRTRWSGCMPVCGVCHL